MIQDPGTQSHARRLSRNIMVSRTFRFAPLTPNIRFNGKVERDIGSRRDALKRRQLTSLAEKVLGCGRGRAKWPVSASTTRRASGSRVSSWKVDSSGRSSLWCVEQARLFWPLLRLPQGKHPSSAARRQARLVCRRSSRGATQCCSRNDTPVRRRVATASVRRYTAAWTSRCASHPASRTRRGWCLGDNAWCGGLADQATLQRPAGVARGRRASSW